VRPIPRQYDARNVLDLSRRRSENSSTVRAARGMLADTPNAAFAHGPMLLTEFARSQIAFRFAMPVLIALIALTISLFIGPFIAVAWGTAAIGLHLGVMFICQMLLKDGLKPGDAQRWSRILLGFHIAISLVWLWFAALQCPNCTAMVDLNFTVIQFSSILIFQAAIMLLAYALSRSALLMALPVTTVFTVKNAVHGDMATSIMGGVALLALLFFYLAANRFKEAVVALRTSTRERDTLIAELETATSTAQAARVRAEDANRAKSHFLATMSHELRTPLNAILGFSEMMRDEILGPLGNDSYLEYAGDIHNSGSHLLKLINEILDLSRIEAGRQELHETYLDLAGVVEEAKHMLEIKAREKNIALQTAYESDLPKVWIDERSIRQVSLNLLSNAVKFTPKDGTVTLKVGWTAKGGQYIAVKDSGPGIPEEEIPLVLSSFGQGSITVNGAERGTGLGLSIVQALMKMHQGRFDLTSKLRQGTEATAIFPRERVQNVRLVGKDVPKADAKPDLGKVA